jgi:hypothetical protein
MLTAVLILVSGGVLLFLSMIPPDSNNVVGVFLVLIGIMNVVFHRRFGGQSYMWSRSMPNFGFRFWEHIGPDGAESLYLGIGIILIVAGSVYLMLGIWM